MSRAVQHLANPLTSERRTHPRQQISFSCVQLDDDNGGIVLNISERGLAMCVVRSVADSPSLRMRFQISRSDAWIETKARIAWVDPSKTTAGVEFINLPYDEHIRVRNWISSRVESNPSTKEPVIVGNVGVDSSSAALEPEGAASVPEPETARRTSEDQSERTITGDTVIVLPSATGRTYAEAVSELSAGTITQPPVTENVGHSIARGSPVTLACGKQYHHQKRGRARKISSAMWIWLWGITAILFSVSTIFLALHLQSALSNRQAKKNALAAMKPGPPPSSWARPAKLSGDPSLPSTGPGFVLQVGAMTHRDNADRLADSLRKKNFPASVSHEPTDRFYRVIVGPYPDANSTSRARDELEKQNFEAIRKPWNSASIQCSGLSHSQ
jgi:septal ring-binding cell division protein DamX